MAYASLVCLINTLDENIQLNLIPQNSQYIQTLLQEASFFQDFLDKTSHRSSRRVKCLETRLIDVAYKARDIVDYHVGDQLLEEYETGDLVKVWSRSIWRILRSIWTILRSIFRSIPQSNQRFTSLFRDLDEVMEEINSIKQVVMQIEEEEDHNDEPDLQPRILPPAASLRPPSHGMTTNKMVGLDDQLKEIKIRLVSGSSQREIVALVGMGGIGKTTLAQKVYSEKSILSHFDIYGWTTVSQEHNVRNILLGLLDSILSHFDICDWATLSQGYNDTEHNVRNILKGPTEEEKLKLFLYKSLKHRRYLIVLDDMWDTQALDDLRKILVNDENGSRILLTTRLKKVAEYDNKCPPHQVRFLNDEESWGLFCEKVFGHDCCPLEFEEVGKEIVRNCRGLPLQVNVIGGHLSKATRTLQYWRSVAKNLRETIASESDDQCSRVLSLSYKHLPHHLKGCFLYLGIFPEDDEIEVSQLVHLWIASGLIKEERSKSFEDVYDEYFLELVERNLIIIQKCIYNRRIKRCKIHDLIRDVCIKEAINERFICTTHKTMYHGWQDKTLYCDYDPREDLVDAAPKSKILRALYWDGFSGMDIELLSNMVNLRYIYYFPSSDNDWIAASIHKFLHMQTIIVRDFPSPLNIWEMSQLRHVRASGELNLADPPTAQIEGGNSFIVLEKLHTLHIAKNLIFTDEVLRRIPNLKKLRAEYFLGKDAEATHVEREDNEATHVEREDNEANNEGDDDEGEDDVATDWRFFGLNNLKHLRKLESLTCTFYTFYRGPPVAVMRDITFPLSIKKLSLHKSRIPWKDMTVVGLLPNLQVLKLKSESFVGEEWEPIEGEFLNLKTLHLLDLDDLVHWRVDADHFPELQHLFIRYCTRLLEIPSGIGEITTLQVINLIYCPESIYHSARKIEEDQHDFGNEGFQVITDEPVDSDTDASEEEYSSSSDLQED